MSDVTQAEAHDLEAAFLGGLDQAQDAYERIMATQAWTQLGHDSYADWWRVRVVPTMRALSMKPTREIAAAGIEQVRREDEERPAAQRHTQREIGDMFGVSDESVARAIGARSPQATNVAPPDLGSVEDPLPQPIAEQIAHRIAVKTAPAPRWSADEIEMRKRLENGGTVVVSMRGQHDNLISWADTAGLYVRIDRRSEWGNPFEMPADGDRGAVIRNYETHYLPNKPSLLSKIDGLRGKALGCWCAPEPCHGDVLAALVMAGRPC